jgi:hypothetical protein
VDHPRRTGRGSADQPAPDRRLTGDVKALDLQRDPHFAIHRASDGADFKADAKVAGRVEEVSSDGRSHRFRADVAELVVISLGGDPPDHLVIESWHTGRGVTTRRR